MRAAVVLNAMAGLLFLSAGVVMAQEPSVRRYPLPNHGVIQLQAPASWTDELRQLPGTSSPTIAFKPKSGAQAEVLLTLIRSTSKTATPVSPEALRKRVQNAADRAQSQAVERALPLKDLKGPSGFGYYFAATDRAPAPGECKNLTQGMMSVGALIVTFTILTNDGQEKIVADALTMLASARYDANEVR
jgi:hypothetical protein